MSAKYLTITEKLPIIKEVDVLVCGGGPAGIGAAISSARLGAKTMLIEFMGCLGGVAVSGLHMLMWTFNSAEGGKARIVGGIPLEFAERMVKEGTGALSEGGAFVGEPESMKVTLDKMMAEAGVELLYHTLACGAIVENNEIKGVIIQNKSGRQIILAKRAVDCTADADVAYYAGCPFEKGREPDGKVQPVTLMFRLGGLKRDAYLPMLVKDYWLKEEIKAAITNGDLEPFHEVMGGMWYCHIRPDQLAINFTNLTDIDPTDASSITKATIKCRQQVQQCVKAFRKHFKGFENCYLIDTAQYIGTRESRRIKGEYILTREDVLAQKIFPDGIANGSFYIDVHGPTGANQAEYGDRASGKNRLPYNTHYSIPYGCLIPLKIENILVAGRCVSATHEALGSTRVMVQCMALGEAAGTASALSLREKLCPRNLDCTLLKKQLIIQGAIPD